MPYKFDTTDTMAEGLEDLCKHFIETPRTVTATGLL
jgi:hypothetical protein